MRLLTLAAFRPAKLLCQASIFLSFVLTGCAAYPTAQESPLDHSGFSQDAEWVYADLRLLDPPDAEKPENDLLAVYLRRPGGRRSSLLDIRLDFLDLSMRSQPDLYILLDYKTGGVRQTPFSISSDLEWDVLLHIPPTGEFQAQDISGKPIIGLSARILRDTGLDAISLRFDGSALYAHSGLAAPAELKFQVLVSPAGSSTIADQSGVIRSFTPAPPPARLLLAFWNTYPAYTPAQALRRWDGAHTGPLGGRHGLSNLLRTASAAGVPLALLDLKYPAWLSALDYAGDLERVEDLLDRNLILLPEYIPPADNATWIGYSQKLTRKFDLPVSLIAYTQSASFIPTAASSASLILYPGLQAGPAASINNQPGLKIVPLPSEPAAAADLQPDISGLSLAARRWLVETAVLGSAQEFTVLGGDLTRATWGNPEIARAAFHYIRTHPWIRPLNATDLLSWPAGAASPHLAGVGETYFATLPPVEWSPQLFQAMEKSPDNPLAEAAAQAYLASAPPGYPAIPEYSALQQVYTRQISHLIAAARWAQQPASSADCDLDIDQDSMVECVLASENIYAVVDPQTGTLTYAFALTSSGAHQLIAPSSQFTFGSGDPTTWNPALGMTADPQVIPGAFYDGSGPHRVSLSAQALSLSDPVNGLVKTFTLLSDGIRVEYQGETPNTTRLALVLDPWRRFEPGWAERYQGSPALDSWSWEITGSVMVEVISSGQLQPHTFTDTRQLMDRVENPNTEFPPGHYLPFPMAELVLTGDPEFWLEIRIVP